MVFKVLRHRTGEDCPPKYVEKVREATLQSIKLMEQRYGMSFPPVSKVLIGDSEYPMNEIHFEEGLVLLDEKSRSYPLTQQENKKALDKWLRER